MEKPQLAKKRRRARGAEAEPVRPRSTINDVARLARVSKKTVSRVINNSPAVRGETRERVNAVIRQTGFVPDPQARGLAFRRAFLIGVIYDSPNPHYIVGLQQGLVDVLDGTGFELVIRPCDRRSPNFVNVVRNFVERQKLAGVVLSPAVAWDARVEALLRDIGCPAVRVMAGRAAAPQGTIVTYDYRAAREAARHLTAQGHRRVGHIAGPATSLSSHERRKGLIDGLKEAGIAFARRYERRGDYTFQSGFDAATALLALDPRPTAIFAANDEMAAGTYRAAHAAGLEIPRDLSVVGFDDGPIASRLIPALTTVHVPVRSIGRAAATKLLAAAGRPADDVPSEFAPALIVRDSVAPPSQ
jgi:LacI family transcriptional regulator